nr:cell division protein ZapE [Microbacterium marinum]
MHGCVTDRAADELPERVRPADELPEPDRDALIPAVAARFVAATDALDLDPAQRDAVQAIAAATTGNVYLWGGVGRGKSMLAERYLAAFLPEPVLRLHLNELFRRLQAELVRDWKAPAIVLRRLLHGVRVLLVDEFHVHDVADAVYLEALLNVTADDGILLIATSNYAPADLLPDPRLHDRFLPAIARIESSFAVVPIGDGPDHRTSGADAHTRFAAGIWHASPAADAPPADAGVVLRADGIPLPALSAEGAQVTFDFADLCEAPVGVRQYQWLADRYSELTLRSVPDLATVRREPLMRFTTLVDVLYDHDVRFVVHAHAPFDTLRRAAHVPPDADRALSRLRALGA